MIGTDSLRAIGGPLRHFGHGLGYQRDTDDSDDDQYREHQIRGVQGSRDELRQEPGYQRPDAESADVRCGGDLLESLAGRGRPVRGMQLVQVGRGGRGECSDAESGDEPCDEQ